MCLHLHYLCCIPIRSVFSVPCMHCNAILPVIGFDCILMFRNSLLQGPPCLTNVLCFTITAEDLVDNFTLNCQDLSQSSTGTTTKPPILLLYRMFVREDTNNHLSLTRSQNGLQIQWVWDSCTFRYLNYACLLTYITHPKTNVQQVVL